MTLGAIIKKYREEQGMSQRKFAELSGMSHSYLSQLESNVNTKNGQPIKPSLETIRSAAAVMGSTLDDLMREMGDELISTSLGEIDDLIMRLVRQLPEELKNDLLHLLQVTVAGVRK